MTNRSAPLRPLCGEGSRGRLRGSGRRGGLGRRGATNATFKTRPSNCASCMNCNAFSASLRRENSTLAKPFGSLTRGSTGISTRLTSPYASKISRTCASFTFSVMFDTHNTRDGDGLLLFGVGDLELDEEDREDDDDLEELELEERDDEDEEEDLEDLEDRDEEEEEEDLEDEAERERDLAGLVMAKRKEKENVPSKPISDLLFGNLDQAN
eukprot:TRINITY_DN1701_c0_g1_i5.p1 TRINITY_DN1701_c0_g1~~TRINITY_DN1701_c0_g1_i5.p1  ORF type:complete len:211 (-),score=41.20 TRINITY_DN1701_c0_g1_i5:10-642(-)